MSSERPGVRLPDTAIEAARSAFHGQAAAIGRGEPKHGGPLVAALTAFCEEMGFEEEKSDDMTLWEPDVAATRLCSRWRPVEGEDRK